MDWKSKHVVPYVFDCDGYLLQKLSSNHIRFGITVTNSGFYAPQGRQLRLQPKLSDYHQKLQSFSFEDRGIINLEMETAGIYGMASLLGHKAVSMNAILANRVTGGFSKNPQQTVDALIQYCLERLI